MILATPRSVLERCCTRPLFIITVGILAREPNSHQPNQLGAWGAVTGVAASPHVATQGRLRE
jgi:hypothetical protein